VAQLYLPAERNSAIAKLTRFADRSKYDEREEIACDLFWGDWLSDEPEERVKELMAMDTVENAYRTWFVFDFDGGDGRTLLDEFLESQARNLSSGESRYLEAVRESHLRLYEVLDVKPEEGLVLRDLWDDRQLFVRERAGTRQIVAWDLIVARVVLGGDGGEPVFETVPYLFRASAKDDLLKILRRTHRAFQKQFPEKGIVDFFKTMGVLFHQFWLDRVALPPPPKFVTGDGQPIILAKVIFDLLDRDKAIEALLKREDMLDNEDGSYTWVAPAGNDRRSLGTIVFANNQAVFDAISRERAEKARDELPGICGDAVRFRLISYEDIEQALKRAPKKTKRKEPDIPIEEQRRILGAFQEQHYRAWPDRPLPAFGNRTHAPRGQAQDYAPQSDRAAQGFRSDVRAPAPRRRSRLRFYLDVGRAGPRARVSSDQACRLEEGHMKAL
jgi:hypothetical protein